MDQVLKGSDQIHVMQGEIKRFAMILRGALIRRLKEIDMLYRGERSWGYDLHHEDKRSYKVIVRSKKQLGGKPCVTITLRSEKRISYTSFALDREDDLTAADLPPAVVRIVHRKLDDFARSLMVQSRGIRAILNEIAGV